MYYCNKCGHFGEQGPEHFKPVRYGVKQTVCDYHAAPVPRDDKTPLVDVANVIARHLPDGWEVRLCIERGAAWVTLHNPDGDCIELPDAADKSLIHQLNDALCVAIGWMPANVELTGAAPLYGAASSDRRERG